MDMTQIDEKWIELDKKRVCRNTVVAISNTGKGLRYSGEIYKLKKVGQVKIMGKRERCSHLIAKHFLITVKRPDQTIVDHITHSPNEYNVNDVRNLRWCTTSENNCFEEGRCNKSKAVAGEKNPMYGRTGDKNQMYGKGYLQAGDKNHSWKGDDVGPIGAYKRALNLYKAGDITEEEFQRYRDALQEYRRGNRLREAKKATS